MALSNGGVFLLLSHVSLSLTPVLPDSKYALPFTGLFTGLAISFCLL